MYRPGGLTALAVFNFVLAGWSLLKLLGVLIALSAMGHSPRKGSTPPPPDTLLYLQLVYSLVDIGLLIPVGIGLLKLKRFLGRILGSAEAVLSLAFFAAVVGISRSAGLPFTLSSLSHLVYPCLTLVLLNWVFRTDLVQ